MYVQIDISKCLLLLLEKLPHIFELAEDSLIEEILACKVQVGVLGTVHCKSKEQTALYGGIIFKIAGLDEAPLIFLKKTCTSFSEGGSIPTFIGHSGVTFLLLFGLLKDMSRISAATTCKIIDKDS